MMTVNELKKNSGYEFKCYINPEDYIGKDYYDDWGGAFIWLGDIGVEYNMYAEEGEDNSCIYPTYFDGKYMDTDTSEAIDWWIIEFTDDNWKAKLEDVLCEAMIKSHNL